jgi:RNA polymerase sigma factor (sigma-70 family)
MSSPSDQLDCDRGGDPTAAARVEQLYASHAGLVRSICRSLLRDRSEAEDAAQQTFLSAQRALLNGSAPRDAAAWLATIARHESLARVRARMREPLPTEIEEGGAAPDSHTVAVRRQEAGELREALAQLPAQQREAILLREVRGLSYLEVASSLSVTTPAVESLLFRARRSLQARLRGALPALSPIGWLNPFREAAATKVAAVGVGAALVAGGAAMHPAMLGLGHTPRQSQRAPGHRLVESAPVKPSATLWSEALAHPAPAALVIGRKAEGHATSDSHDRRDVSDRSGSDGAAQEAEHSGSGDTSSSGASSERGNDGQQSAEASSDDSQTTTSGDSQTTTTTATDDSQTTTTDDSSSDSGSGTPSGPDG